MLISSLLLILGLTVLIKCASFLVDGAVIAAEKLHVSPLVVGLTIVAFGTSAPELAVNLFSALTPGARDVGLGNIIGSNIANIALIIGVTAVIVPLTVKKIIISREIPFMFLSAVTFLILVADRFFGNASENVLSISDGAILLLFFCIFLYYLSGTILSERNGALEKEFKKESSLVEQSWVKAISFILIGIGGVILGGNLTVDNALVIARGVGVSEILLGLTVVAVGTSLPELVTSVTAALKKQTDIAVGSIVGSNVFNTFLVLGVSTVITPVPFDPAYFVDVFVMVGLSLLLFVVSFSGRTVERWEGASLLFVYTIYILFIVFRG
jgi:cation:H+ antiporter